MELEISEGEDEIISKGNILGVFESSVCFECFSFLRVLSMESVWHGNFLF